MLIVNFIIILLQKHGIVFLIIFALMIWKFKAIWKIQSYSLLIKDNWSV